MSFATTDGTSGFVGPGHIREAVLRMRIRELEDMLQERATRIGLPPLVRGGVDSVFTCLIHPWATLPCGWCDQQQQIIKRQFNPAPAPESAGGEEPMSLIDERQVEVLDGFRAARDTAKRHAQSKVDRATMMKIQAEALIAEARELVAELNEDTPYPMEQGADIGPVRGAGGDRR